MAKAADRRAKDMAMAAQLASGDSQWDYRARGSLVDGKANPHYVTCRHPYTAPERPGRDGGKGRRGTTGNSFEGSLSDWQKWRKTLAGMAAFEPERAL